MTTVPAYDNSVRIGYARVSTRTQDVTFGGKWQGISGLCGRDG